MLSLNARLLTAASIVLAAFLTLTGLALDRAFRHSALASTHDRLHGQALLLISATDIAADGEVVLSDLPEPRYASPASGLFAEVADGAGEVMWRSDSSLGVGVDYPAPRFDGNSYFEPATTADQSPVFVLSFGVIWELDSGEERRFQFRVAESAAGFDQQVAGFRKSLWLWFSAAAGVLLLLQASILRWGLTPLRQVASEVREIEAGRRQHLSEHYPRELHRLTRSLNELVRHGQRRLDRYRNALDDLAHSLKTPLAVLRSITDSRINDPEVGDSLSQEIERMHRAVSYQLQRAAASGRTPLSVPVDAEGIARRLAESLGKVYADKQLQLEVVHQGGVFRGDEGDLTEILGNLMDNACKWASKRVTVRFSTQESVGARPAQLLIDVEDDGPGFADSEVQSVLQRGVRSRSSKAGQGIGLAVVREVVEDLYDGQISLGTSADGGAAVRLTLP